MTPHETAVKIAEAVMDAIEKRRGIVKDDLIEAARGVIAGNLSGPASGYPMAHYGPSSGEWYNRMKEALAAAEEKKVNPPGFVGLDLANGRDVTKVWIKPAFGPTPTSTQFLAQVCTRYPVAFSVPMEKMNQSEAARLLHEARHSMGVIPIDVPDEKIVWAWDGDTEILTFGLKTYATTKGIWKEK